VSTFPLGALLELRRGEEERAATASAEALSRARAVSARAADAGARSGAARAGCGGAGSAARLLAASRARSRLDGEAARARAAAEAAATAADAADAAHRAARISRELLERARTRWEEGRRSARERALERELDDRAPRRGSGAR
jgi:hypothetical protein